MTPNSKLGTESPLFSYGNWAVSEIFSANLVPGLSNSLNAQTHGKTGPTAVLSVADYERLTIFYEE